MLAATALALVFGGRYAPGYCPNPLFRRFSFKEVLRAATFLSFVYPDNLIAVSESESALESMPSHDALATPPTKPSSAADTIDEEQDVGSGKVGVEREVHKLKESP